MRNGTFLQSCDSEIWVKRISINQGVNVNATENSYKMCKKVTINCPIGLNWSKYKNMFHRNISPHDFYKMTLLGTRSAEVSEGQ